MIAQLKYGSVTPFYRLEKLRSAGHSSTSSHAVGGGGRAAELLKPALDELIRQGAQGDDAVHNDDTSMKVLKLEREPGDERTGVFTSGIVLTGQGQKIAFLLHRAPTCGGPR